MLNYIWLGLVAIGILTAAGRDIFNEATNRYGNGQEWEIIASDDIDDSVSGIQHGAILLSLPAQLYQDTLRFQADIRNVGASKRRISLQITDEHPPALREIAEAQGDEETLVGYAEYRKGAWRFTHDEVRFVWMKRITNATLQAAELAVTIAIGLIGIMALWLGVMKVAEEAGLIALLAKAVRPVTTRLFPEIPDDHPAISAMLMNIAANMLGLGNAATPFGLKAMEHLNDLNPKVGTATNSMVTFLALNTSCITLIPATAIAVRAASGSADPAAIIGTTMLASLTATIVAVTVSKLLQRLPFFRIREEAS